MNVNLYLDPQISNEYKSVFEFLMDTQLIHTKSDPNPIRLSFPNLRAGSHFLL
jgi:hypothetical protein